MKPSAAALVFATLFIAPAAMGQTPSLVGQLPSGNQIHITLPPTEADAPSLEIWEQVRKSELMMSINVLETSNRKVTAFYKKEPCQFVSGQSLSCEAAGASPLAGTQYEWAPESQTYACTRGCGDTLPKELSVREPLVFDMGPDGELVIDQHGP